MPWSASSRANSVSSPTCQSSTAMSSSPVRSNSASIPCLVMVASMPSRFSRPSRSSVSNSSGNRAKPLASPWVRLLAQKPPLRPDAAQPTVAASTRMTSRAGSASLACSAVHRPV